MRRPGLRSRTGIAVVAALVVAVALSVALDDASREAIGSTVDLAQVEDFSVTADPVNPARQRPTTRVSSKTAPAVPVGSVSAGAVARALTPA